MEFNFSINAKLIKGNQRHLSLDDRIYIEKALEKSIAFKDIALFLSKDPTTISKEVKKHRVVKTRNTIYIPNNCMSRQGCTLTDICIPCTSHKFHSRCASCSNCNKYCPKYVPNNCSKLLRAPFVCNGCDKKNICRMDKYYYRATTAHSKYRTILSTSREGINLSEDSLSELDSLVSPLIKQGQPISHIFLSNSDVIPCGRRTLYNYINNNILTVRNIDLPRKVKYKPRKRHTNITKDHSWREGRKYSDFLSFLGEHPDTSVVEMDTVEGTKGGKVLLTMLFRNSRFMTLIQFDGHKESLYNKNMEGFKWLREKSLIKHSRNRPLKKYWQVKQQQA
ncbi:helix-turn-helix domain-containing protein [Ruminiclostridium josui]|uniref:helix-turn-helix domain-containing protein n=2 Tax=Ruminiclostridium josui TaxID=1499 RepID=UPI003BF48DE4